MGCHRGVSKEIKKLVVREDGTVLPEVPNLNHEFALGNIRDGPLSILVRRYFDDGYSRFDSLCRTAYGEILPSWDCVIVPWEQILAERSRHWTAEQIGPAIVYGCGGRSPAVEQPAAMRLNALHRPAELQLPC